MDLVFRNATIVDGTGSPAFTGDVVVRGGRIAAVRPRACADRGPERGLDRGSERGPERPPGTEAGTGVGGGADPGGRDDGLPEVDCTGLVLTPGFIDIHSHSDFSIFEDPSAANYAAQGVTLIVSGNCGYSGAPINPDDPELEDFLPDPAVRGRVAWRTFREYLAVLDRLPKGVNVAWLVGHGNVRGAVLGFGDRPAAPGDLEKMKAVLAEAFEAGAFGLSSGLIYVPGIFATTDELVELAGVAARYGGLYATHIRNESDLLVEAVLEAIDIGRRSGARVEVSHHKASGKRNFGLVRTTLDLMGYYRRFGVEVSCDVYPCTASSTTLYSLFPRWARAKGKKEFVRLLGDAAVRASLRSELTHPSTSWENVILDAGFDGLVLAESTVFPEYLGKSVADIAKEQGARDPLETALDLVRADPDLAVIAGGMSEDDVRYVLAHRLSLVGSDGSVTRPGRGSPHPRSYRAFTRVLETYVREEKVLGLEEAVRKMSGLPAWKLGLWDRGLVRPGFRADLAVFDLWALRARSEFGDPHHLSEGMVHVLVNGEFVIRDGRFTGGTPGEVVRRT